MPNPSPFGPTKTRILHLLLAEDRTAVNIASTLHIQVSAARKHLEELASLGLAAETFLRGTVGRPKKTYSLTEEGKATFPKHYDTLLSQTLAKLVEREGAEYAESLLKSIAKDVAKNLDARHSQSAQRVKLVQAGVNKLGFEASFGRNDGSLTVLSRNCPVWNAAKTHGEIVCRGFHAEVLKLALGGEKVSRAEWMVDGDRSCKHTISGKPESAS